MAYIRYRTVRVPNESGPEDGGIPVIPVRVAWVCPTCGEPRGEPTMTTRLHDGAGLQVHTWLNPCGHLDLYEDVIREAARNAAISGRADEMLFEYGVPNHTARGILDYLENGVPPGGFLNYVLTNDLMGAFRQADDMNRPALFNICSWLYNHAPIAAHGSPQRVKTWIKSFNHGEGAENGS